MPFQRPSPRKRKLSSKPRTKSTVSATSLKKSFVREEARFSVRSADFLRKRKVSTERWRTSRKRTSSSTTRSKPQTRKRKKLNLSSAVRSKCSRKFQALTRNRLRIICSKLLNPISFTRRQSRLWNTSRKQRMKQTKKLVKLLQRQFSAAPQITVRTLPFPSLLCLTMR